MNKRLMTLLVLSLCTVDCRRNDLPVEIDDDPDPLPVEEELSFTWNGIPSHKLFNRLSAGYNLAGDITTIATFNDSTLYGKFFLQFMGDEVGRYVYRVYGGPSDSNQVFIRFVPDYAGSQALGLFELTGLAADSLEAEVQVTHFGEIGGTVSGTFGARLKDIGPSGAKVVLSGGTFTAPRVQ